MCRLPGMLESFSHVRNVKGALVRKRMCAVVALTSAAALLLNNVAWTFQLSGAYKTRIEHVGSIPSAPLGGDRHIGGGRDPDAGGPPASTQPVSLPAVDSGTFHSSQLSLRPELKTRRFSFAGEYVIRTFVQKPRLLPAPSPVLDSYPGLPPFESSYQWGTNSTADFEWASGNWERFWGTVHFPTIDLVAGAKDTPFGVGATLGSDMTHDIVALHWSIHNLKVIAGTGLWIPVTGGHQFSILPPAPWNALRNNGLYAGSYLSTPQRKTEQVCKKRPKTIGVLDTVILVLKVIGWLATLGEPSEEEDEDLDESKKSTYASSEDYDSCPCWKRCDCDDDDDDRYEYYDCHDVVVYDPTPEEIRTARINGLTSFHEDRADVHKPFNMFLISGDFPYFRAGIGGIWFPTLRRSLPGGAPNLNPAHDVDNARLWLTYLHYQDKRYFAKLEYSSLVWNAHPDAWSHERRSGHHLFAELGTQRGPFKASLMAALASGAGRDEIDPSAHFPVHHQALAPYESLMFHRYGGGNLAFQGAPGEGKGMISDAYALGARFEYAAAANLSLWTSALWAHRLGNSGAKFGQFASSGLPATARQRHLFAHAAGRSMIQGPDDYGYVSDGSLGYECNVGADWSLTHYLNVNVRAALWQPGAWFKEAHQGLGLVHPGHGATPVPVHTRPPIYGLSASLVMAF